MIRKVHLKYNGKPHPYDRHTLDHNLQKYYVAALGPQVEGGHEAIIHTDYGYCVGTMWRWSKK